MRRLFMGVAAAALSLALAPPLAAQSEDEHGCWVAPSNCVSDTSDWIGDDFASYYTSSCSKRVFIVACNEAAGLDHSALDGCRTFGLAPGETREWRTAASHGPTGRYAYGWVGSATEFGNDFTCSKKFGLRSWKPDWYSAP